MLFFLNVKLFNLQKRFGMCLLKRWKPKKCMFAYMLHFVASLFSRQNCLRTREVSFKRRSKQCISLSN